MQVLAKAVKQLAGKEPLDISNTAQFRDACLAAARLYGWKGESQVNVAVNAEKAAVVVCTELTALAAVPWLIPRRGRWLHRLLRLTRS